MLSALRTPVRRLRREPMFVAATVLTLAVGAAANTAAFNLSAALLAARLPVPDADRLVRVCAPRDDGSCDVMSYPNLMDLGERSRTLSAVTAHQRTTVSLGRPPATEMVSVELVSGRYFEVMGLRPFTGRLLAPEDDVRPGAHPVVVIGHERWRRQLGGDVGAVGRTVELAGTTFTIVGVAPAEYQGSYGAFAVDFWAPLAMYEALRPRDTARTERGWGWLDATARLAPDAGLDAARAEAAVIADGLRAEHPRVNQRFALTVLPARALPEGLHRHARGALAGLQVAALLVLFVGTANVASAQMARAVARRRETAVRLSLGASRVSLLRWWGEEAVLLALAAAVFGIALGVWLRDALVAAMAGVPGLQAFAPNMAMDLPMMVSVALLMAVVGLAAGAAPALRSAGADPWSTLKQDGGAATSVHGARWQTALVGLQVALSTALLGFALTVLHAVQVAQAFDPGFPTEGLVLAQPTPVGARPDEEQARRYFARALDRLRSVPGVVSASYALVVPLGSERESRGIRLPGRALDFTSVGANVAGPRYFTTMGIRLVAGRDFNEADARPGAPPVAVVNESLARRFFPSSRATGERLSLGNIDVEIVGVARDIAYHALGEPPRPYLYLSAAAEPHGHILHARVQGGAAGMTRAIEAALGDLDPRVVVRVATFDRVRAGPLAPQRLVAWTAAGSGAVALFLTAVGIFALMAYAVGQRTREIGIRVALGARPWAVRALVLRRGLLVALAGGVPGTAAALFASHKLAGGLLGLTATDPIALATLWTLVAATTAGACWLPARRATRVDPVTALRQG